MAEPTLTAAAALDAIEEGVLVHDAEQLVYANRAAGELLGVDRDDLRGRAELAPQCECVSESGTPLGDDEWPVVDALRNTDDVRAENVGDDGEPLALDVDAPQWTLDWWADATTAVGVAITSDDSSSLLTCAVPDGTCKVIEASTGAMVRFPTGATDPSVVKLLGSGG